MNRTYYEILGLGRDASPEEVKSAYRKLCRTAHPDMGGSAALFGIVQEAYETLKNPLLRREYDQRLGGEPSAPPYTEPPRQEPPRQEAPRREPPRAERPAGHSAPPPGRPRSSEPPRPSEDRPYSPDPAAHGSVDEAPQDSLLVRAAYGVAMVVWVAVSQLLRDLERALGLEWVQDGDPLSLFFSHWSWVLGAFLLGAVVVVVPWEARKDAKPFPWWEQLLVALFLAAAHPLGLWWFKDWTQFLALVWIVAVYTLLTRLRRPAPPEPPSGPSRPGWRERLRNRAAPRRRGVQPFERVATSST